MVMILTPSPLVAPDVSVAHSKSLVYSRQLRPFSFITNIFEHALLRDSRRICPRRIHFSSYVWPCSAQVLKSTDNRNSYADDIIHAYFSRQVPKRQRPSSGSVSDTDNDAMRVDSKSEYRGQGHRNAPPNPAAVSTEGPSVLRSNNPPEIIVTPASRPNSIAPDQAAPVTTSPHGGASQSGQQPYSSKPQHPERRATSVDPRAPILADPKPDK